MVEQNQGRFWVPTRTYDFQVKIGKKDYTADLYVVQLISSIETPYQTFVLDFALDAHDIILEKIYGQTPIKLIIRFLGPVNNLNVAPELERIEFDLMTISSEFMVPQYETVIGDDSVGVFKERRVFRLTTIPRNAYKLMNTIVNGVYYGSRVSAIITSIFDENFPEATLRYDTIGKNTEVLRQALVPPTTFYEALRYLDRTFGLYDGVSSIQCDYNNVVYIKNLTSRIKLAHTLTLWHLATNVDSSDILETADNTIYYTYQDITTTYSGNSIFSVLAPINIFSVAPSDSLYSYIPVSLEDFASTYGLISKGKNFFYDKDAINPRLRVAYHKDHTGYDSSETFINANLGKKISEMATLTADITKFMYIEPLLNVGHSVQVHSKVTNMRELTGKYILKASEIMWKRTQDWNSGARVYLIRTNRSD
jgi:hypothetical protein